MLDAHNIDQAQRELQHYERIYSRYLKHICSKFSCRTCHDEKVAYKALQKSLERVAFDLYQDHGRSKKKEPKRMAVAEIAVGSQQTQDFVEDLERVHERIMQELEEEPQEPEEDDDF